MSETHKDNPEIQKLDKPKDPPNGGATTDSNHVAVQDRPRGDDDQK